MRHFIARHFCWWLGPFAAMCAGDGVIASADPVEAAPNTPAGQLVVGKNSDGRLELFQIDFDSEVRHRWQKERNGDWSPWSTLGGSFLPGIAVGKDAAGEMEVFAVDQQHNLNWIRQKTPGGHEWSKWNDLGGAIDPPLVVGRNTDGRLEIFAIDALSRTVKHLWQTNLQGGWSGWGGLGDERPTGLAVASNHDGRLEIFGADEGHHLVHCWQQQVCDSTNWSQWADLGGEILPGLAAGQNDDGQLEVFAVGAGNSGVQRIVQSSAGDSIQWQPWTNFGGNVTPGIALGQDADGRLGIFAVKKGGSSVQHRWQLRRHEDRWSGWKDFLGEVQPTPVIERNADGSSEIFAIDEHNASVVDHRRQIIANHDYLPWSSMDRSPLEYSSRVWQTDEGLPNNRVQAIAQTGDGYLWVGTLEGLARFDGLEFKTYNCANTPQLKNASITALCSDAKGGLWIGTEGGGLVRLWQGRFSLYTAQDGLAGDHVRAISQSHDGAIWIASTQGLSRFRDGKFQTYTVRDGLLSDAVTALCEDPDGFMWVATTRGLNRLRAGVVEAFTANNILAESQRRHWNVGTPAMDAVAATNGLSSDSIRSLCLDRGHRLWIGSDYGLMWYSSGNFYAYTTLYGLSDNFVITIYEDSRNNLWAGTYSGLNRFIEGRFHTELNNHGIPYDQVNVVFEDAGGDIWVGSREGLIRLTPKPFTVETKLQGLSHNHVTSVLEDHLGGLWVGTWGGGLNEVTADRVRVYGTSNRLSSDLILALCEGHDGSIWAGADNNGGLFQLRGQNVAHYTERDGLIGKAIISLHEDRENNLWIGTQQGLCRRRDGKFVTETKAQNLPIRAICEDSHGQLWFGGDAGLMRSRDGNFENLSGSGNFPAETVSSLYADAEDNLWVGTLTGGLLRWRREHWDRFSVQDGLFSSEVLGIVEAQGWLWLSSTKGIFRVRKNDLESLNHGKKEVVPCIVYGKADGLESIVCGSMAAPAVWKTADNRLYFATTKGLAVTEADDPGLDLHFPQVYIEQVEVDRKPVPPLDGQSVTIPPSRGELDIRYTALDLRAPEKCRFKYRLDGVDSDWVNAETHRAAHYNNVIPGTHRFHVLACNRDGVWNETGAYLDLELRPHLWQTWWFRTLAVAALIGLASGSARLITQRKMQRKLELMERKHAVERERGRIAKDIHDDLGSSLTRIMLLGQRAKGDLAERKEVGAHLEKIINFSRGTIQSMDEIVWAVNPRNDNLDGLVNYLVEYVDHFFEDTGIRCRLQMPIASQLTLPTEVRHDLFLAVKEALNNVLKHSMASEVQIQVVHDDSTVSIVIDDNGCGFDLEPARNGRQGNGLQNMRKRLDALGGQMELVTAPGHGTKLRFTVHVSTQPAAN
jgi:ligand-binding sensor domain-containing protein/signal transduction histidine kinase